MDTSDLGGTARTGTGRFLKSGAHTPDRADHVAGTVGGGPVPLFLSREQATQGSPTGSARSPGARRPLAHGCGAGPPPGFQSACWAVVGLVSPRW